MTESGSAHFLQDLGDGLVLRRSTAADAEKLGQFNAKIHGENPMDAKGVEAWTRDLILTEHPTSQPDDFLLVENVETGEIVSSLCLISQTWSYEGIPFLVGRPELVGTDPAYRKRGLVRRQFDVVHEWCQSRAQEVQVITGIPYYYRQFGYEMGLNLGGGRLGYGPQVKALKEGEQDPYQVRLAEEKDLAWLIKMYALECRHSMVNAAWDEALWRYEIYGKSTDNVNRWVPCVIEDQTGKPVGYLAHPACIWGTMMPATRYQVDEGVSFAAVTPSVVRYLWKVGQDYAAAWERKLETFGLWLGAEHPAYQVMGNQLRERPTYAFYVRVPDLPAFLHRIAPVLEKRLCESVCAGYTGELKISFYRKGVKLAFDGGRLVKAEDWMPLVRDDEGSAGFPNLTFLQMVFGYRRLDEIRHAYADCWCSPEAALLLEALFPKKASNVWGIS